ncbi:MAG: SRPBCC family protein [Thermoplasmata archaeon]|nr:SRPBCC family protein [Thermoplasmata archaeon]
MNVAPLPTDVDVECEVLIARTRGDVAAYMFDPDNDGKWTAAVLASRPLTPGRLRTGSRVERTVKFGGREFTYEYSVTGAEGDRFVEMKVDKPFPMHIRYELDEVPGGTRVRIRTSGEPKGFFRLAAPLMKGQVRKSITNDLGQLKAQLETNRSLNG